MHHKWNFFKVDFSTFSWKTQVLPWENTKGSTLIFCEKLSKSTLGKCKIFFFEFVQIITVLNIFGFYVCLNIKNNFRMKFSHDWVNYDQFNFCVISSIHRYQIWKLQRILNTLDTLTAKFGLLSVEISAKRDRQFSDFQQMRTNNNIRYILITTNGPDRSFKNMYRYQI